MEQPNSTFGAKSEQDVAGAACDIKARGSSVLHNEKTRLIGSLHGVVNALDESARRLRQNNDPNIASYIEMASDRIDQAGRYLERANAQQMLRDASTMARRNPVVAFGGLFLAGIGLARVIKNVNTEKSESDAVPASEPTSSADEGNVIRHFQAS